MKKRPKNSSTTTTHTQSQPYVYECADFFLARFANLPRCLIHEIDSEEKLLAFYHTCPLLQEAIAHASPSLDQALKKGRGIQALRNYFIRMCTRTTPFGLFTSVAWGEFKEKTDLQFDPREIRKSIPQKPPISSKVIVNPQAIVRGNRLILGNRSIKYSSATKHLDQLLKYKFLIPEPSIQPGIDAYVERTFSLNKEIQRQVEEAATKAWHSSQGKKRISKTLHRYFLERYGPYRFVPLTEFLADSMVHSILQNSEGEEVDEAEPPPSMELHFQLSANNELILTETSTQALSTFGRFTYLWDENKIDTMKDFLKKEEELYPHILFVETSFIPEKAPSLAYYTPLRKTQFNDIDQDEILIGAHADHLYAFSNKLNQELSFVPATALNLEHAPIAIQLLITISRSRYGHIANLPKSNIENPTGNHAVEFVVPLVRKTSSPPKQIRYPSTKQFSLQERVGTDWFYVKLYLPEECADDFLKQLDLNAQWFYVRYKDDRFHLRLRIRSPSLLHWVNTLLLEKRIEDYSICPYEREIERYGCMEAAEEIFYQDSLACIHLLKHKKELNLPLSVLGAYGILHYLRFYQEPIANFFNPVKVKGIRGLKYEPNAILETAYAYIDFGDYKTDFLAMDSLIHMHCNRLGLSPKMELKARAIAHYLCQCNNKNR